MDERIALEAEQLVLFKRAGLWQARIKLATRSYLWRSLRTPFIHEAKQRALTLYHGTRYRQSHGFAISAVTMNAVIDEYIAFRSADHLSTAARSTRQTSANMLRQIKRVSVFWRQYCGQRDVASINDAALVCPLKSVPP